MEFTSKLHDSLETRNNTQRASIRSIWNKKRRHHQVGYCESMVLSK